MKECSNGFVLMVPERLEQERLWTSSPCEPSLTLCHAARVNYSACSHLPLPILNIHKFFFKHSLLVLLSCTHVKRSVVVPN